MVGLAKARPKYSPIFSIGDNAIIVIPMHFLWLLESILFRHDFLVMIHTNDIYCVQHLKITVHNQSFALTKLLYATMRFHTVNSTLMDRLTP